MSSTTSYRIWFHLFDSATGQPYKRTSTTSVYLPPGSDVADFRDAVKAEYDQPYYLRDTASSTLLVYKNKAAFDKRNASIDEGKEEPLEPDSLIDGLGETGLDPLIVVVRASLQLFHAQPSSSRPCSVPFFNSICDAIECDEWVSFAHSIPIISLNKLFIRDCYRTIASSIEPGVKKAIISGTPGIGKTIFLIYLLWRLVKEGKRVLFIYRPFNVYYDGQGGVILFASRHLPLDNDYSFWNETLWCLFDERCHGDGGLDELPYGLCTFIVSTYPRRKLLNDFKKGPKLKVFYMPTWTAKELETIAPCFPAATEWRDRYEILGGIPRHVLEQTEDNPIELLEAACQQCELWDCTRIFDLNSTIESNAVHHLVHMTSSSPFTDSSVCYASGVAFDIIVRNKRFVKKSEIFRVLDSCGWNHLAAAFCECIFEQHSIELLEKGGSFECRELVSGNKRIKPSETTLNIPSSIKRVAAKVKSNQSRNQLYVPRTKNYTAIDAWIPGVGAFQMTVGKKHDIKKGVRDDLAKLGQGANKLYWLLPPTYYNSFTKKSPEDIVQYAVKIPYPEYG